jgi:hypothetical protein
MRFKLALTAAFALGAFASPAAADYWIIRGVDRICEVVDEEPDAADETVRPVGQQFYVTREAAEKDMAVACRD